MRGAQRGAPIGEIEKAFGDRVPARGRGRRDDPVRRDRRQGVRASGSAPARSRRRARRRRAGAAALEHARTPPAAAGRGGLGSLRVLFDAEESSVEGAEPLDFEIDEIPQRDSGVVLTVDLAEVDRPARAHQCRAQGDRRRAPADLRRRSLRGRCSSSATPIPTTSTPRSRSSPRCSSDYRRRSPIPRDRAKLDAIRDRVRPTRARVLDRSAQARRVRQRARRRRAGAGAAGDRHRARRSAGPRSTWRSSSGTLAIGLLRTVIARSPGEADYHAALGWAAVEGRYPRAPPRPPMRRAIT